MYFSHQQILLPLKPPSHPPLHPLSPHIFQPLISLSLSTPYLRSTLQMEVSLQVSEPSTSMR